MMKAFKSFLTLPEQDKRDVFEAAASRDRILLVMATGTGKTYTAFQIIWRLWKAGRKRLAILLAWAQGRYPEACRRPVCSVPSRGENPCGRP